MSKEECIEILSDMRAEYNIFVNVKEATRYHCLSIAIKALKDEPVGKWIDPQDPICYKCSNCGRYVNQEYGLSNPIFYHYCPWCGAKMEGVENA